MNKLISSVAITTFNTGTVDVEICSVDFCQSYIWLSMITNAYSR